MVKKPGHVLKEIYNILSKEFGPQHWWPGDSRFEVIIGAILTQNTNWGNVEKAIHNLKAKKYLFPKAFKTITKSKLSLLIKPAGYFNVKTKRIKNFIEFFLKEYRGSILKMMKEPLPVLREKLLGVNGIGPETADSILLYSCDKPIFVIDAYTKRILSRHKIIKPEADYSSIQKLFMDNLKNDVLMFNEYHALIVRLGKDYCKTKPLCESCPLNILF